MINGTLIRIDKHIAVIEVPQMTGSGSHYEYCHVSEKTKQKLLDKVCQSVQLNDYVSFGETYYSLDENTEDKPTAADEIDLNDKDNTA